MTAAVFRAEFRRALPLWPWLLACHALALYDRVSPMESFGRSEIILRGFAPWGLWSLSTILLVGSLWADNPSRRDHFLASRPVRGLALLVGKFGALFLLICLPFVLADLAASVSAMQPSQVLLWGILQTSLFSSVALLAIFALTWAWATRTTAAVGLLLAFAGVITVIQAVAEFQPRFAVPATHYLLFAHRQLVLLAAFAVAGFSLPLALGKRWPWRRVPLFAAACGIPVFALLKFPEAETIVDTHIRPALVHLDINLQPVGERFEDSLQVKVPAEIPGAEFDRTWSFSRLEANGRRVPEWYLQPPTGPNGGVERTPVQAELQRHFGEALRLTKSYRSEHYPATAVLPGVHDPSRSFAIELSVLETITRWEVVADMPLQPGATATHGASRWSIGSIQPFSRPGGDEGRRIRVRATSPALWLPGLPSEQEGDPRYDQFYIVDVAGGQVRGTGKSGIGNSTAGRWSVRDETKFFLMFSREQHVDGKTLDWSRELRLAILRPVVVRRVSHDWKSQQPIPPPVMSEKGGWLGQSGVNPEVGAALKWLDGHPAPAADASWQVIRAWLDELHSRINRHHLPDAERETLIAAVAPLAVGHLEDFLRYRQDLDSQSYQSQQIMLEAMVRTLEPGVIGNSRLLANDAPLVNQLAARGRLPEVASLVADFARSGRAWRVQSALFADPAAIGLTQAEWRDFYRLYPGPTAFIRLSDSALPRSLLEEETDRIIEGFETQPLEPHHLGSHVELAMARGHAAVPAWLQRWLANWREQQPSPSAGFPYHAKRFFEFPPHLKSDSERADWFLEQDPSRFVFDPATARFHLR
jgi:hypothetical protein